MPASEEMESIFSRAGDGLPSGRLGENDAAASGARARRLQLMDSSRDPVAAIGFHGGRAASECSKEDDCRNEGE
jgi:hypothetical protein